MSALPSLPETVLSRANVECPLCGGDAWVCEAHPNLPWENGSESQCRCGAPGMPCRCTGMR